MRERIVKLTKEAVDNAPKAGLVGGEWEQVSRAANFCTTYSRMAERATTDKALAALLEQVMKHHRFIMDTANKKRRPHPERSRRRFP